MPILKSILKPNRETYPGKYRDTQPCGVCNEFFADFAAVPCSGIQFMACIGIAFNFFLYPGEHIHPDCLKAEISAEYARSDRSDGKQRHRQQQQQPRNHPEVLGEDGETEDMKLTIVNVQQYRLFAVPSQIGAEEENQPERFGNVFKGAETTRHALCMHGSFTTVELPLFLFMV